MKNTLLILGIAISFACSAQNGTILETLEGDVLYRGYKNKVTIVADKEEDRKTHLTGVNASMTYDTEPNTYIVKPMNGKTTTLYALAVEGDKVVDTLFSKVYTVKNLPVPDLYWGEVKDGGKADVNEKELSIRYQEGVALPNNFVIKGWEITMGDEKFSGNGNNLSSAQEFLDKMQSGTELIFKIMILSSDGITRLVQAQWEV